MGDAQTSYTTIKAGNHFVFILSDRLWILTYKCLIFDSKRSQDSSFILSNRYYNFADLYDKYQYIIGEFPNMRSAPIILHENAAMYQLITSQDDIDALLIRLKLTYE